MTTHTPPLFNWLQTRSSGVLLHMSSLPSSTGIGNLGAGAYAHIDFMQSAGLRIWQLCPLGPTGYGDSPYQSFSSFAGNPYFIDLDPLLNAGLLSAEEIACLEGLSSRQVEYGQLYRDFYPVLAKAHKRFALSSKDCVMDYGSYSEFVSDESDWLQSFARFTTFKAKFKGTCWQQWPSEYLDSQQGLAIDLDGDDLENYQATCFYQYLFFAQFRQLKAYAHKKGVELMGDIPIFVAYDSADVWAHPHLFQLKPDGVPTAVAGVPPDYFSENGQKWGNPLYDWPVHEKTHFSWWLKRIESHLKLYDLLRIDHFRGFEAYWSIPAEQPTAKNGQWLPSPGIEFFKALKHAFPEAKIIAEDLGEITPQVEELLAYTGLPRMLVLQFAFDGDSQNGYLPHNYSTNSVVYSGTHDNDTSHGWFHSLNSDERDFLRQYLAVHGDSIAWDLIRAALKSVSMLAIIPMQDLLNLGSEARLNTPGQASGNWQWRMSAQQLHSLHQESAGYLNQLLKVYGRLSSSA